MKANIKLTMWIPLIILIAVIAFLIDGFNVLDIIMIGGGGIIISYFVLGFFRRKDALIIEGNIIKVKSPIRYNEYFVEDITNIFIKPNDNTSLRAIYKGENIALCTDIYDVPLREIKAYILAHYPNIQEIISDETTK